MTKWIDVACGWISVLFQSNVATEIFHLDVKWKWEVANMNLRWKCKLSSANINFQVANMDFQVAGQSVSEILAVPAHPQLRTGRRETLQKFSTWGIKI